MNEIILTFDLSLRFCVEWHVCANADLGLRQGLRWNDGMSETLERLN